MSLSSSSSGLPSPPSRWVRARFRSADRPSSATRPPSSGSRGHDVERPLDRSSQPQPSAISIIHHPLANNNNNAAQPQPQGDRPQTPADLRHILTARKNKRSRLARVAREAMYLRQGLSPPSRDGQSTSPGAGPTADAHADASGRNERTTRPRSLEQNTGAASVFHPSTAAETTAGVHAAPFKRNVRRSRFRSLKPNAETGSAHHRTGEGENCARGNATSIAAPSQERQVPTIPTRPPSTAMSRVDAAGEAPSQTVERATSAAAAPEPSRTPHEQTVARTETRTQSFERNVDMALATRRSSGRENAVHRTTTAIGRLSREVQARGVSHRLYSERKTSAVGEAQCADALERERTRDDFARIWQEEFFSLARKLETGTARDGAANRAGSASQVAAPATGRRRRRIAICDSESDSSVRAQVPKDGTDAAGRRIDETSGSPTNFGQTRSRSVLGMMSSASTEKIAAERTPASRLPANGSIASNRIASTPDPRSRTPANVMDTPAELASTPHAMPSTSPTGTTAATPISILKQARPAVTNTSLSEPTCSAPAADNSRSRRARKRARKAAERATTAQKAAEEAAQKAVDRGAPSGSAQQIPHSVLHPRAPKRRQPIRAACPDFLRRPSARRPGGRETPAFVHAPGVDHQLVAGTPSQSAPHIPPSTPRRFVLGPKLPTRRQPIRAVLCSDVPKCPTSPQPEVRGPPARLESQDPVHPANDSAAPSEPAPETVSPLSDDLPLLRTVPVFRRRRRVAFPIRPPNLALPEPLEVQDNSPTQNWARRCYSARQPPTNFHWESAARLVIARNPCSRFPTFRAPSQPEVIDVDEYTAPTPVDDEVILISDSESDSDFVGDDCDDDMFLSPRRKRRRIQRPAPPPSVPANGETGFDDIAIVSHVVRGAGVALAAGDYAAASPAGGGDTESIAHNPADDELVVVGAKRGIQALVDLPHMRFQCGKVQFGNGTRSQSCPMCYCFVCDTLVAECSSWTSHCRATDQSDRWKVMRERTREERRLAEEKKRMQAENQVYPELLRWRKQVARRRKKQSSSTRTTRMSSRCHAER